MKKKMIFLGLATALTASTATRASAQNIRLALTPAVSAPIAPMAGAAASVLSRAAPAALSVLSAASDAPTSPAASAASPAAVPQPLAAVAGPGALAPFSGGPARDSSRDEEAGRRLFEGETEKIRMDMTSWSPRPDMLSVKPTRAQLEKAAAAFQRRPQAAAAAASAPEPMKPIPPQRFEKIKARLRALRGVLSKSYRFSQMSTDELAKRLTGPDADDRKYAIRALAVTDRGSAHIPQILDAAENDPSADVRLQAIGALGKMKAGSAVDALSRILGKSYDSLDNEAQTKVATALGEIGTKEAVLPLSVHVSMIRRNRLTEFYGNPPAIATVASLLKIGEKTSLEEVGRIVEREMIARGAHPNDYLQDATYSPIADALLDALVKGAPSDSLHYVLAQVREPSASRLIQRAVRAIQRGYIPETIYGTSISGNAIFARLQSGDDLRHYSMPPGP
ncbi:MAG: HEAT repeat domain-containing protein [Elusimicrobiota bacterium]